MFEIHKTFQGTQNTPQTHHFTALKVIGNEKRYNRSNSDCTEKNKKKKKKQKQKLVLETPRFFFGMLIFLGVLKNR